MFLLNRYCLWVGFIPVVSGTPSQILLAVWTATGNGRQDDFPGMVRGWGLRSTGKFFDPQSRRMTEGAGAVFAW